MSEDKKRPDKSFKQTAVEDTAKQENKLDNIEPTIEPAIETSTETAPSKLSFDEWINTVDDDYKTELQSRVVNATNEFIHSKYGELTPILDEIENSPELMKALSKLSDKDLRDFLLNDGIQVYESSLKSTSEITPVNKELENKLAAIESKLSAKEKQEQDAAYFNYRRNEVQAMQNEYPELRFEKADKADPGYRKFEYLVDQAETRTQLNYARGVNKSVSYKEVYDELRQFENNRPTPTKIENTSSTNPKDQQAPQTITDSKKKLFDKVKRAGSFAKYAEMLSGNE